eukprot:scaffold1682_cov271-Prasinococcus_capsulatus_cf.AAC.4
MVGWLVACDLAAGGCPASFWSFAICSLALLLRCGLGRRRSISLLCLLTSEMMTKGGVLDRSLRLLTTWAPVVLPCQDVSRRCAGGVVELVLAVALTRCLEGLRPLRRADDLQQSAAHHDEQEEGEQHRTHGEALVLLHAAGKHNRESASVGDKPKQRPPQARRDNHCKKTDGSSTFFGAAKPRLVMLEFHLSLWRCVSRLEAVCDSQRSKQHVSARPAAQGAGESVRLSLHTHTQTPAQAHHGSGAVGGLPLLGGRRPALAACTHRPATASRSRTPLGAVLQTLRLVVVLLRRAPRRPLYSRGPRPFSEPQLRDLAC